MDTHPASQYLNALGMDFTPNEHEAEAACQLLKEAGFTGARVEIGWGSLDYDDENKIHGVDRLTTRIKALQNHGIRPIVLLNAHSGWPCPSLGFRTELLKEAQKGDRKIQLKAHKNIKAGYCGFRNLNPRRAGWPIILSMDKQGWDQLSSPLPKALKVGPVHLVLRKYPAKEAAPMSNLHLSILSQADAPSSFKTKLPDPLQWKIQNATRKLKLEHHPKPVVITCEFSQTLPSEITSLLPELSVTDKINQRFWDWGNRKAVRVDVSFDIAAHPGLNHDTQRWIFTLYKTGVLTLHLKGTRQAMRDHSRKIDQIIKSFVFK